MLNYLVAVATARNRPLEKLVEGVPVVLARHGKVFDDVLKRQLVSPADFREALRVNNIVDVNDVDLALLETNGHISIVTRQGVNRR